MNTIGKIASEIAKREGKRSQARIGDVREILGILSDMVFESLSDYTDEAYQSSVVNTLAKLGIKRAKKKKR